MNKKEADFICQVRNGRHIPCTHLLYRCIHSDPPGKGLTYDHCKVCRKPLEATVIWKVTRKHKRSNLYSGL